MEEVLRREQASFALIYLHRGGVLMITKPRDGNAATCANGGTIGFAADDAATVDAWHAACCVHHGGVDSVFVDGVLVGKPARSVVQPTTAFEVGGAHGELPAKRFAGTIDEVRVSNVARDPAWLAAEFATRGDVVAFGAIELL